MWNDRLYELLAAERIEGYHREAEQDRRARDAVQARAAVRAFTVAPVDGTRRRLVAALAGLAAVGALRPRR